jgi:hypothetical protein
VLAEHLKHLGKRIGEIPEFAAYAIADGAGDFNSKRATFSRPQNRRTSNGMDGMYGGDGRPACTNGLGKPQ